MQHSDCVELEVIRALQKRCRSRVKFTCSSSYLDGTFDFHSYDDSRSFKIDYMIYNLLRKWKGHDYAVDLEDATFRTWIDAEKLCFVTNRRLSEESASGSYSIDISFIVKAQVLISSILGDYNEESVLRHCRFGNGATSDLRRGNDIADKMVKRMSVTKAAIPLAFRALWGDQNWAQARSGFLGCAEIVRGSRMVTVPKSAKTHRMIAAEPTLNSFVQQGFGRYIRSRLKRIGVDLNDQTINQDLAFRALVDGFSTIDLSSASDTLSYSLVKLLLPAQWFEALDSLRCPVSSYNGKVWHLSKFSSMGNAYTFELESLIFYALCKVVSEQDPVSVYGDDIIIKHNRSQDVLKMLTWAGFKVNRDKSFFDGSRFFESCGRHFFDLEDVTPPYQKDVCSTLHDYVRFYNRLYRASLRLDLRNEFRDVLKLVLQRAKERFGTKLPVGPLIQGDFWFVDSGFVFTSDCMRIPALLPKVSRRRFKSKHEHAAYAYKLRLGQSFSNSDPRGRYERSDAKRVVYRLRSMKVWTSAIG